MNLFSTFPNIIDIAVIVYNYRLFQLPKKNDAEHVFLRHFCLCHSIYERPIELLLSVKCKHHQQAEHVLILSVLAIQIYILY